MSYANFKKVHEDESHARFKHANGSELKVAKKGLSSKMRKELEGLPMFAEGGDAPSALQMDQFQSADQVASGIPGININIGAPPATDPVPDTGTYDQAMATKSGMAEAFPGENQKSAAYAQNPDQLKFDWDPKSGVGIHHEDGLASQSAMPSTPGGDVASNGPGLEGAQAPPGAVAAPEQQQLMQQAAPVAPQPSTPQQHYQATHNEIAQDSRNFQQDLDAGHITPKTYHDLYAKKDTLGKIGTIFGLMMSGAGSALAHQPNMLMEMMNSEIKNDLEAQTKSATNKIDWFKANQQSLMNHAQIQNLGVDTALKAKTLANIQMNQAALHSLVKQAEQYPVGSPQRAKAEQVLAMLSQGVQSENYNLMDRASAASAYYSTMFGSPGSAQASADDGVAKRIQGMKAMGNYKAAEDLESRFVPGVGLSPTTPVPESARKEMVSKQKLLNTGSDLLQYSKTHNNIIPGTPEYKYGVAKAMAFQQEVREGMLGTVFRESEKPLLEKFVNENPAGAFKALSTQPKLRAILDTTKIGLDTQKKAYNLPTGGGESQQPQQQAGRDEVRYDQHGNAYRKGPDGRPVKINQTAAK